MEHVIELLEGLLHGPCAGVTLVEYDLWLREKATELLFELQDERMRALGFNEKMVADWKAGVYNDGRRPNPLVILNMTPAEVIQRIAEVS